VSIGFSELGLNFLTLRTQKRPDNDIDFIAFPVGSFHGDWTASAELGAFLHSNATASPIKGDRMGQIIGSAASDWPNPFSVF
jgi:hypothetical protein